MKLEAIPFRTIDWARIAPTTHPGAPGVATWRTVEVGNVRVRMVEYSPGYVADHWCRRGHVLLVLDGQLTTEIDDGRRFVLSAGELTEQWIDAQVGGTDRYLSQLWAFQQPAEPYYWKRRPDVVANNSRTFLAAEFVRTRLRDAGPALGLEQHGRGLAEREIHFAVAGMSEGIAGEEFAPEVIGSHRLARLA